MDSSAPRAFPRFLRTTERPEGRACDPQPIGYDALPSAEAAAFSEWFAAHGAELQTGTAQTGTAQTRTAQSSELRALIIENPIARLRRLRSELAPESQGQASEDWPAAVQGADSRALIDNPLTRLLAIDAAVLLADDGEERALQWLREHYTFVGLTNFARSSAQLAQMTFGMDPAPPDGLLAEDSELDKDASPSTAELEPPAGLAQPSATDLVIHAAARRLLFERLTAFERVLIEQDYVLRRDQGSYPPANPVH